MILWHHGACANCTYLSSPADAVCAGSRAYGRGHRSIRGVRSGRSIRPCRWTKRDVKAQPQCHFDTSVSLSAMPCRRSSGIRMATSTRVGRTGIGRAVQQGIKGKREYRPGGQRDQLQHRYPRPSRVQRHDQPGRHRHRSGAFPETAERQTAPQRPTTPQKTPPFRPARWHRAPRHRPERTAHRRSVILHTPKLHQDHPVGQDNWPPGGLFHDNHGAALRLDLGKRGIDLIRHHG